MSQRVWRQLSKASARNVALQVFIKPAVLLPVALQCTSILSDFMNNLIEWSTSTCLTSRMSVTTSRHMSWKKSRGYFFRNENVKAQKFYQNLHTAKITEGACNRKCHFRPPPQKKIFSSVRYSLYWTTELFWSSAYGIECQYFDRLGILYINNLISNLRLNTTSLSHFAKWMRKSHTRSVKGAYLRKA